MTGRAAETCAVAALAVIVTAVLAIPVLHAPSERLFGMEIAGRHHDPFTVMEQFGRPMSGGVYFQPFTDVPGALIARVFGPVAAYNWLVLLTFPLSAVAAYLLARHLSLSPASAAIAAMAFAFSPFHLSQAAYHAHIAQTQWIPLYLLALWRCLDRTTPATVAFLTISIAAVVLSNFYGGLIAAVVTPVAIATYWGFTSRYQHGSLARLVVTTCSLLVIAGAGLAYAWHAMHVAAVNAAAFAVVRQDVFRYSAAWRSYFISPVEHPVLGRVAARIWNTAGMHDGLLEQQVSLGWGVVVLSVFALFAWLRSNRQSRPIAAVPVLAGVAAVAFACSLSPEGTIGPLTFLRPSFFLYRELPMFRAYARFGVVVQLMAVLLAGIGAECLWRSQMRRARIFCVALLVLAAAEYAVWPPMLWRDVLPTASHRWIVAQPNHVQALDCVPLSLESRSVPWLSESRISLLDTWIDDCAAPNLADKLSVAGYTHVIARRGTPAGERFASHVPLGGLNAVARFDDSAVFAVEERTPLVATVDMRTFYSPEHDDAWAWQWMGREASWTVLSRSSRPITACVDVDMMAFHSARRLRVVLDERDVQMVTVDDRRGIVRLGPFDLEPGAHRLEFQAADAPAVAADLISNGDRRPLSFAFGMWRWIVQDQDR
jgi:hypothetical protein